MLQLHHAICAPLDRVKDFSLIRDKAFIDGEWIGARETMGVFNPATGALLASVPVMGAEETARAVAAAGAAAQGLASMTAAERSAILRRWHGLIIENAEDLAMILTAEQGKPLTESRGEIAYGASFVEWFAEEAKRIYGDIIPAPRRGSRIVVLKQPVGVVGAITPWNFPNAMITRKCAPAFAAGCPVVIKPSELTPLSAFALAVLAERAGFPRGALNVVTGDSRAIGRELTSNATVRKISFTGSTRVGKLLMAQASEQVKKLSLELGGNAPLIVFDDADLDTAVQGAIASKFRNSGQTCVCANRIYVQSGIYGQFTRALVSAVGNLRLGSGIEDGVTLGPLINAAAVEKVERHIADAASRGGKVVFGGQRSDRGGTFFEPTIMTDANADMLLANEETFGPLAALFRFDDEKEVIASANATPYGLAAYVFTRDADRQWRVGEALETGMVGINTGLISNEVAPFGGVKESGIGREGSKYGIEEFLNLKYLLLSPSSAHPQTASISR